MAVVGRLERTMSDHVDARLSDQGGQGVGMVDLTVM